MGDGRDDISRGMYQQIIRQLHHDGYARAAEVVSHSTLTAVADPFVDGDRLLRTVRSAEEGRGADADERREQEKRERWKQAYQYFLPGADLRERYQATHQAPVRCVRFSEDGRYLASGGADGKLQLHSVAAMLEGTGGVRGPSSAALARVFAEHGPEGRPMSVNDCHFSPAEGGHVLTACRDGCIRLFNYLRPNTRRSVGILKDEYSVRCIAPHVGGVHVLSGTDHPVVRLWDLHAQKCVCPEENARTQGIRGGGISRSGGMPVNACAFSPDGRTFATGSADGLVTLWDPRDKNMIVVPWKDAHCGAEVTSVTYSRDGLTLLSSGRDGCCRVFELRDFKCIACYGTPPKAGPVAHRAAAHFTAHGECVAGVLADRDAVHLIDRNTRERKTLAHTSGVPVRALATSPDSPFIATGDEGNRVRLWAPEEDAAAMALDRS